MDVKNIDLKSVDHVLRTTRAVRKRLDLSRPVDPATLKECIEIALQAPTGLIGQTWNFLVITDAGKRALVADIYRRAVAPYNEGREVPDEYLSMVAKMPADSARQGQLARMFDASRYLTEHMHKVPALVVPCIKGRVEHASPGAQASLYGSIFPAIWSFQLALRARGIGSTLTTVHICHEQEVAKLFNIPEDFTQAALLAVAYFKGNDFRPADRLRAVSRIHWNGWGNTSVGRCGSDPSEPEISCKLFLGPFLARNFVTDRRTGSLGRSLLWSSGLALSKYAAHAAGTPTQTNCPDISSVSCPTNADCECFTLAVPASNPVVGSQVNGYATAIPTPVAYGVGAVTTTCSPSMLRTDPTNPIVVIGGAPTVVNPTLSFADCL